MKIYHWWPGRTWAGPCPIPEEFIEMAIKRGSKYMTVAKKDFPQHNVYITTAAFCNPKDVPCRAMGRHIAVERLKKRCDFWELEL
jgi:hypothetical protein